MLYGWTPVDVRPGSNIEKFYLPTIMWHHIAMENAGKPKGKKVGNLWKTCCRKSLGSGHGKRWKPTGKRWKTHGKRTPGVPWKSLELKTPTVGNH